MENYQSRKSQLLTEKFANMGQRIVSHQSGYLGLEVGDGRQNRVGVEEAYPQGDAGDIAQALAYVQQIAETYPYDFARWAATSDILQKADSDSSPRKATIKGSSPVARSKSGCFHPTTNGGTGGRLRKVGSIVKHPSILCGVIAR